MHKPGGYKLVPSAEDIKRALERAERERQQYAKELADKAEREKPIVAAAEAKRERRRLRNARLLNKSEQEA